jgi:hypothetical protein
MFYLVKTAGLDQSLYVGDLANGIREGAGIQYFPNGYKYTGSWQKNRAHGPGRLEYTDGTFYEGTFNENRFIEGVLSFYSGAKFIGKFSEDERQRERFMEGSFIFTNGDQLKTTWNNGIPQSGNFVTKEGKIHKFSENERAVFLDQDDSTRGKIIMANSTEIYEGGIKDKIIHGKGIIYSSFPHYEEAFYTSGKPNGPYTCNYIHGGYCYEGSFKNGQRVGKWKYQSVKGFFYEGEANLKSGKVLFPYLNDDHFIGDVDIQFHNITLLNGMYNMMDSNGKYIPILVQNIKNLSEIPEIKDRKLNIDDIAKRFQKSKIIADEPILNGIQIYNYPDGSYFKGNFNYDFIYINKKDLLNCYFPAIGKKNSRERPALSISSTVFYRQECIKVTQNDVNFQDENVLVIGNQSNDKTIGFCKIISSKHGFLCGSFRGGKLNGFGKRIDPSGEIYISSFIDGIMHGNTIVYLPNDEIIKCTFVKGEMDESNVTLIKQNGLIYKGGIHDHKKQGRGELTYTNGYKYIGEFENGEINTSHKIGNIVKPDGEEFECLYTKVENRQIGILETVNDGDIYVYNSSTGSLKKAQ